MKNEEKWKRKEENEEKWKEENEKCKGKWSEKKLRTFFFLNTFLEPLKPFWGLPKWNFLHGKS